MIKAYLQEKQLEVENFLDSALVAPNPSYGTLYEAMNYSLLQGGKRVRPILSMMVLDTLGVDYKPYMQSICAIELIHTYSLIHDDLPAMDDDDYRRGKLTNHKVYGDGMATLAGDGLLTEAFTLLATDAETTPSQVRDLVKVLAICAGPQGMVGGQSFDLSSEGKVLPLESLQQIHKGKTGALFKAAVEVGLILGKASKETREAYDIFAEQLGLLFQITDDILDVTSTLEELGKMPGSDVRDEKVTYVSILGLEEAKVRAEAVADTAKGALLMAKEDPTILSALVDFLLKRTH
mgnify:CR=1 FL=1